jgi:hypothetical protein
VVAAHLLAAGAAQVHDPPQCEQSKKDGTHTPAEAGEGIDAHGDAL